MHQNFAPVLMSKETKTRFSMSCSVTSFFQPGFTHLFNTCRIIINTNTELPYTVKVSQIFFITLKLKAKRFSTEQLIGKYQISKSKGKAPLPTLIIANELYKRFVAGKLSVSMVYHREVQQTIC